MSAYETAFGFVPIVHIVAVVFAIIELGLTAYDVSVINGATGEFSDRVNFMLFNSIWSLLVLAYVGIAPLYFTSIFHRLISLALESLTMLFWFAGSIALAARVGSPSCGSDHFCGSLEGAIAFGFFLWIIFAFLVALDAFESLRSRRSAGVAAAGPVKGPAAGPYPAT